MEIETFSPIDPTGAPTGANIKGAVVAEISTGSQAATAGIQANDAIVEINGQQVGTPAMLDRAIRGAKGKKSNVLRMSRNGREYFAVLP